VAGEVQALYYKMFQVEQRLDLMSATGQDLDNYAASRGLQRRGASFSSVLVTLTASGSEPIEILAGLRVSAGSGIAFESTQPVTLSPVANNSTTLRGIVSMRSDGTGSSQNVPALSIRSVLNPTIVPGSVPITVTNLAAAQGGEDSESDATFRTRILTLFSGLNQGTALFYEAQVRNLNPNIVRIFLGRGAGPGEVLVYCVTADGAELTTAEKTSLEAGLSEVVPVQTKVTVRDMILQPINVAFTTTLSGDATAESVAYDLAETYQQLLNWSTWPFYRSVQADDLLRLASATSGVDSLRLSSFSPAQDVPLGPATLPRVGTITVQDASTGQTETVSGVQQLYPRL
jgi:hypothetical protein